jgi:hypothetical protein
MDYGSESKADGRRRVRQHPPADATPRYRAHVWNQPFFAKLPAKFCQRFMNSVVNAQVLTNRGDRIEIAYRDLIVAKLCPFKLSNKSDLFANAAALQVNPFDTPSQSEPDASTSIAAPKIDGRTVLKAGSIAVDEPEVLETAHAPAVYKLCRGLMATNA